eukprot:2571662-Prymnesium_polylepis.1
MDSHGSARRSLGSRQKSPKRSSLSLERRALYTDTFRFRLVEEDKGTEHFGQQAVSQTYFITKYVIHWQPGFNIDYSLVVVDTPGFGDTKGIHRDFEITKQVKSFFGAEANTVPWVPHLNGIGFVAKSAENRLTPTQKYVIDSVLSLFGKNVENAITVCATFCDAGEPKVKEALRAHEVPMCALLKFNNSAVYAPAGVKGGPVTLNAQYWNNMSDAFSSFTRLIGQLPDKAIDMTQQVMKARSDLEHQLKAMQDLIAEAVASLSTLENTYAMVQLKREQINKFPEVTIEVTEYENERVQKTTKQYLTNCNKCKRTCHDDCPFSDAEKGSCFVFQNTNWCYKCKAAGFDCK